MRIKGIQIFTFIFLALFLFLSYNVIVQIKQREKENDLVQYLPGFTFCSIDGHNIKSSCFHKKTLIVIFNSECDCCIGLTKQIMSDTVFMTNNDVIMISAENIEHLRLFKTKLRINLKKIQICSCDSQSITFFFGNHLVYPSIFYYDENKKLIRKGKGELNLKELSQLAD